MATELSHVQHDPSHCLVPGLFRSFSKGERSSRKLDVTYRRDGFTIRFMGVEPLGPDDLRFLQGIVAFAGRDGVLLTPNATLDVPKQLRVSLLSAADVSEVDTLMVSFKSRKLLEELGMSIGGSNVSSLKASLIRMSTVTVIVESVEKSGVCTKSYHLLSFCAIGSMREVSVALNPYLADAILCKRPYTRIDLSEIRRLEGDAARLIHQRLCGFINSGNSQNVGLETLISYVWGSEEVSPVLTRQRRKRIFSALEKLRRIGWHVHEYRRDFFRAGRP